MLNIALELYKIISNQLGFLETRCQCSSEQLFWSLYDIMDEMMTHYVIIMMTKLDPDPLRSPFPVCCLLLASMGIHFQYLSSVLEACPRALEYAFLAGKESQKLWELIPPGSP